jgi:hypothetical protein
MWAKGVALGDQDSGQDVRPRCVYDFMLLNQAKPWYQSSQDPVTQADGPLWTYWSWGDTALPPSALAEGSKDAGSAATWLQGKPYLFRVSRSSAERVFLVIGLMLYNLAGEQDDDWILWLNLAESISEEIRNSDEYKYVCFALSIVRR